MFEAYGRCSMAVFCKDFGVLEGEGICSLEG